MTASKHRSEVIDTIYFTIAATRPFSFAAIQMAINITLFNVTFLQNHYTEIRYRAICYNRTDDKLYYTVIMPTS